jgi:hypothetical protein
VAHHVDEDQHGRVTLAVHGRVTLAVSGAHELDGYDERSVAEDLAVFLGG